MPDPESRSISERLQAALTEPSTVRFVLRLFVTGMTPRSTRAVANVRRICETYLPGRYDLEVIDIYQQPVLAKGEQIVAAPTLIRKLPLPRRCIIGDLSDTDRVLMNLDLARTKDS